MSTSSAHAASPGKTADPTSITVGSAAFPEAEVLAEVYGEALEQKGFHVTFDLDIGQRQAYIKAMQQGAVDLVPEYSGNLLQFYKPSAKASSSAAVYARLKKALPSDFEVLDESRAQDKDSYNVTQAFSKEHDLTSLTQLKSLSGPLKIAANPEFSTRPAGAPALKKDYGVSVTLVPISDSGGPLTVKALADGNVQLADIFTTSPAIRQNHFVTLKDPKEVILAQNVLPLIRKDAASPKVVRTLNALSKRLTTADLVGFNAKSDGSAKESPAVIARQWLAGEHL